MSEEKRIYCCKSARSRRSKRLQSNYPEKVRLIRSKLEEINQYEKKGETNLDLMAGLFGDIMAEIFAWKPDAWNISLPKNRILPWQIHLPHGTPMKM